MIDCERWDVVTALFLFTEAPVRKPRPILVLSNGDFNRVHGHVIACMITTGAGSHWPSDHRIVDLAATGLSHPSLVRWKLFTLPVQVLGRKVGALARPNRAEVTTRMARILS